MKDPVKILLVSVLLSFGSVASSADEAGAKFQIENIAQTLVDRLPLNKRIVLKTLSPAESGLPEDFLRKLTSDLEAALLEASNFEITLANRLTTEEIWSEAIEFGDADFEELFEASKADVMLMLVPRATQSGVEISLTAYQIHGRNSGRVIASSGSSVLSIDVEKSLGINLETLDDRLNQLVEQNTKIVPKADIEYFQYPTDAAAFDTDDLIVARVNDRRFIAFETDLLDRIVNQKDIDNDGYLDAIVYSHAGGNGSGPTYFLVSYRGDGSFSTHELETAWRDPELIADGNKWKIRFDLSGQGVGYGVLEDGYRTFSFENNNIVSDAAQTAIEFSDVQATFQQAYDAIQDAGNGDQYTWNLDIDFDGNLDQFSCYLWERWGYLQDCVASIDGNYYSMEFLVPDPEFDSPQCKIVGFSRQDSTGAPVVTCDYEKVYLKAKSFRRLSNTDLLGNDITTNGIKNISQEECEYICIRLRNCSAYTYVKDLRWCWPKSASQPRKPNSRTVSGAKVQ